MTKLKNKILEKKVEHLKNELDRLGICVEYHMHRREMRNIPDVVERGIDQIQQTIIGCISRLHKP